jgi:hypothetical protein
VLLGLIAGLIALSVTGNLNDSPEARGEKMGRGLGMLGGIAAAIAYFIQRKRLAGK